jgi:hypothetical protein
MPLIADANNITYWVRILFSAISMTDVSAMKRTFPDANLKIFLQNTVQPSQSGKPPSQIGLRKSNPRWHPWDGRPSRVPKLTFFTTKSRRDFRAITIIKDTTHFSMFQTPGLDDRFNVSWSQQVTISLTEETVIQRLVWCLFVLRTITHTTGMNCWLQWRSTSGPP